MAELAPIGWVLSPIMKIVLERANLYLGSQYNWKEDMQKNLEKLKNTLIGFQTIVYAADQMQSKNPSQEQLLSQLKDTIYEADDLLDEFDYRILETQAMEAGGWVSHVASSSLKVAKRLIGQDKLLSRLKELLNKLDSVRENAQSLNVQAVGCERSNASPPPEIKHVRLTSSIPPQETFGRTKEKEELINLLLNEPESSHTNIPIIAIVGEGGIGKTTLAQLVYNEQKIIEKFKRRIWICVSDDFGVKTITQKILESASGSHEKHKDVLNFDVLQRELQNKLQDEEFLLVLDDVWIDEKKGKLLNQEMWKTLLAPLQKGKKGSKILVTTRMRMVVEMFNAMSLSLVGLTSYEMWFLLKKCVFDDENTDKHPKLQNIGIQIAERLSGSPLAAKVVGTMLKDRLDVEYWLEISKRKIFDDIMSILGLSYQCLPVHLKHCFAYCSIFPKDWKFEPEKLVSLWIAQGYVHCPDGIGGSVRSIGMDYFYQLLSRSFFEKVQQGSYIHYVMHDLLHDLAQFVSKNECLRIDGGKQVEIPETITHLGIVVHYSSELKDILAWLEKMSNLKKLRTLILFGYAWLFNGDLLLGIFKQLRSLRVLDFNASSALQFPEALSHYLHLRYLNLGKEFLGILPKSFSRLYHLQVMSGGQLPLSKSMFGLFEFGELKFLDIQRLEFKVGTERHRRIGVLKKDIGMEVVVGGQLCIQNLENVSSEQEAKEAELGTKQYLYGLELHWDFSLGRRIDGHDADQEVIEALKPHPNLKSLTIKGFGGSRCPVWLKSKWLDNLQSLELIDCSGLEELPSLDHLPLLKTCIVERCPKLMSFPRFPSTLEFILITDTGLISKLSLWLSSSSPERLELSTTGISSHATLLHDQHLWAIQKLTIKDCKEHLPAKWLKRFAALKELEISICEEWLMSEEENDGSSILPPLLESLNIYNCPVTERWLSRCLQGLTFLKELRLMWCPELKSLPQEDGGGVLATSLELLVIWDCPVTDLSLISHCTSLKNLNICKCCELKSLPQEDGGGVLATSLESLEIWDCPVTDLSLISHCTSLKNLNICDCCELKSLPQVDGSGILLPSLESLFISNCPFTETWLSRCTPLKKLDIWNCRELKSLPEEGLPTSLEEVGFVDCSVPKESVVRCLEGLPSLSRLTVDFWNHLTALPTLLHLKIRDCQCEPNSEVELPQALQSLEIFRCDVSDTFLSTCLQGLTSLSMLEIERCDELTSLPSAQVLHRLTRLNELTISFCKELTSLGALHTLASLKNVYVCGCPKLKSLPREGLPSSIQILNLSGCHPELKQLIRRKALTGRRLPTSLSLIWNNIPVSLLPNSTTGCRKPQLYLLRGIKRLFQ